MLHTYLTVEQIFDVPGPMPNEPGIEASAVVPQTCNHNQMVEQIVDVPVPTLQEIVGVVVTTMLAAPNGSVHASLLKMVTDQLPEEMMSEFFSRLEVGFNSVI